MKYFAVLFVVYYVRTSQLIEWTNNENPMLRECKTGRLRNLVALTYNADRMSSIFFLFFMTLALCLTHRESISIDKIKTSAHTLIIKVRVALLLFHYFVAHKLNVESFSDDNRIFTVDGTADRKKFIKWDINSLGTFAKHCSNFWSERKQKIKRKKKKFSQKKLNESRQNWKDIKSNKLPSK